MLSAAFVAVITQSPAPTPNKVDPEREHICEFETEYVTAPVPDPPVVVNTLDCPTFTL